MIPFLERTVLLSFIFVMGNGPMNYNSCLEFFYAWLEFFTNLVLVVIPAHIFAFVIMINSKLFVLSNVFPVGNMLNVYDGVLAKY